MSLRIGIDIGGTFTDIVAISPDGTVTTHKTASTPHDYGAGIIDGLRTLLKHGMPHFENNYASRGAPVLSAIPFALATLSNHAAPCFPILTKRCCTRPPRRRS